MKELWLVIAYNSNLNQSTHFLMTGTHSAVEKRVDTEFSVHWKITYMYMVAYTYDDVFREF